MPSFYPNLLSPLKIGGVVLKNRMMATNSMPHFLQGPESFPADSLMYYFEAQARNGAAIITFPNRRESLKHMAQNDMRHFAVFNVDDETVQNYLSQLADTVHFYGSRASFDLWPPQMAPENACNVMDIERELDKTIETAVREAKLYQSLGFDMTSIYMPYRAGIAAQLLSPLTNHRNDRFGGCVENRARYILEICRALKEACGQDFLIDVRFSGLEGPGGITIDDTVAFAKLAEGLIDIFQLRAADADLTHPVGFNSVPGEHVTLQVAQAIKASGARVVTAPSGGFQDLDENERYIAEGKADLIAMARAFICDPEYAKKAGEGRGDDVVPCLRCNKCHVSSLTGPWVCVCSVNPQLGMGHKLKRMVDAPARKKKVAVVGGGPAGMSAALYAADRGHDVTLFEKAPRLGGQTVCADGPAFKWPVRRYRDYLIRQLTLKGVDVRLNTETSRESLEKEGFDAVIAAVGCEHLPTPVPGADGENVFTPVQVYGRENEIGQKVAVIGGAQKSVETAMYLAQLGHDVTLLTRRERLAYDATPIHYYEQMEKSWSELKNFHWLTEKRTVRITDSGVIYSGNDDQEHLLLADSVVASGGVRPLQEMAMSLHGAAPEFHMIGDCERPGCIHDATRRAFAAASQI